MNPSLGGPGVACSALRVRRLEAGELEGEERVRVEAHLSACGRCQATSRELARERSDLAAALPFETFAAGVAERLAGARTAPRHPVLRRFLPLALAAGLAAAAALPVILKVTARGPSDRVKGVAALTVYARRGDSVRALAPGEPVPAGGALRLGLSPGGRAHAAVVLLDADGAAVLYAGPARQGVLPGAFEWTGRGAGRLVAVLDDAPLDAEALARDLAQGGPPAATARPGAEFVVVPLTRGEP